MGNTLFNEKNCRFGELDWDIQPDRIALICLDIWHADIHQDMSKRDDSIVHEKIVPLLSVCRKYGLRVIHAPSAAIAQRHPNWVKLTSGFEKTDEESPKSSWPPMEYKMCTGPYRQYAVPEYQHRLNIAQLMDKEGNFHALVRPEGDEAVIATGEELHLLCAREKILFLRGHMELLTCMRRDINAFSCAIAPMAWKHMKHLPHNFP
jgi:hypothetical protein